MFDTDDATPTAGLTRTPPPELQVPVTPLDMRQARFSKRMRGFDPAAVTTFLEEASGGFERALRENERLRQEIGRLEGLLSQFRDLEGGIKNTLVTAQRVADDLRDGASQDASRIVREAENRAEFLVEKAHGRVEDIEREVDALRLKGREAEVHLESIIAALQHTLEFVRERDGREPRVHERAIVGAA